MRQRVQWMSQAMLLVVLVLGSTACGPPSSRSDGAGHEGGTLLIAADVEKRLAQFVPTSIDVDTSALSSSQQEVLGHLLRASEYMNPLFLRQAWVGNPDLQERLEQSQDPLAPAALDYFRMSYGPWDRLDEQPFIGAEARPETAGYYPEHLSRREMEAWLEQHPGDKDAFQSLYTVIRRHGEDLVAIPYTVEYREWLQPAAEQLQEAAEITENQSLAEYLRRIAAAFVSEETDLERLQELYYQADLAWMALDSKVEITIGPYEVYEDRLFGYKAAFVSFVTLVDPEESAKLVRYKAELPAMERNLPIPDEYKNLQRGTESPMRVVDEIYTAGDTRAGVQTIAFNLPNDERVRETKGSKKVMLRNVMNAKFQQILQPIAGEILVPDQLELLSQEQFFNEVLFHELAHGLGPGKIQVDGRDTEVRLELKELYSPMEEAKADVMGMYNLVYLMDRGILPAKDRRPLFATYLAGIFRATRFGVAEAHGKGTAMQFNYLLEKGAILEGSTEGTFGVNWDTFADGIRDLLRELCILQAQGDYPGASELLQRYGVLSPALERGIARLERIPVDLLPSYPAVEEGK